MIKSLARIQKPFIMTHPKLRGVLLPLALLFILPFAVSAADPDGASLFKANCAACHSVGKGKLVGPDLKDIQKRQSEDWLLKWIKSSASLRKSGDAYANEIFGQYNIEMPDQSLSPSEIKAVLGYIKSEGDKASAPASVSTPVGGEGASAETDSSGDNSFYVLLLIAVILLVVAAVLTRVRNGLQKAIRAKNGIPEPALLPARQRMYVWARSNKKLIAVAIIVLGVWSSVKGWYMLADVGISQGYQPDQPIAFSHKLHAGEMKISCIYCHSGAEKSKTAGVPSVNVCMNCHKAIRQGPTTGTAEIAKIYAALDYDPNTMTYGPNSKPLVWTRVHNLPDLAYFNHSQHVKVGGVKCQTCHGPVEEMTVAKQFAPLTMGWCINCHRTTQVKLENNHYYDNYHPVPELMGKHGRDTVVTVEKIGGTECARCHY